MSKIAFIIPIYPPDYKYKKNILKTFKENKLNEQADLWFVFTNEDEAEEFGEYNKKIILDETLREFKNRGFINIKKFYAIKQLKDRYEYLIVLDSELEFIKNVNLKKICDEYFENKTLYGNQIWGFQAIRKCEIEACCKKYFRLHPNFSIIENLSQEGRNGGGYMWFNNLPIYKTSTVDEFFNVIDYEKNITEFSWEDFDYYIYMYYLILYHNFKVEDLRMFGLLAAGENIPEGFCCRPEDIKRGVKLKMCAKSSIDIFDNDELFITVHLDRNIQFLLNLLAAGIDRMLNKINTLESMVNELPKIKKQNKIPFVVKEKIGNKRKITLFNFIKISYKKKENCPPLKVPYDKIRLVEIEIFSYCNRHCWFCQNSFIDRHSKNILMDEKLYSKILAELKLINYSGTISYSRYNEPFSHIDIFEKRLKEANAVLPNAALHTNSNGDYITKETLERAYNAGLRSLNIQCYIKEDEEFNIENIKQKIIEKAQSLNLEYSFNFEHKDWIQANFKFKDMNIKMYSRDFKINGTNRAGSLKNIPSFKRNCPCYIPFRDIYIDYNGSILPCCNFRSDIKENKKFILGNANKDSILNIFNNKNIQKLRKTLRKDVIAMEPCNSCNFAKDFKYE